MRGSDFNECAPKLRDVSQSLFLIIFLYTYLFQPPVVDKIYFVLFEVFVFLFFLFNNQSGVLGFLKLFKVEISIVFVLILFCMVRDFLTEEIVYLDRFLAWGFQSFIFGGLIIYLLRKHPVTLINLLYWTCLLAAVISVLLLLNPTFDNFYKSIQLDGYYEKYSDFEVRYRAYGVAENLTFTYAFVMGLFGGYSFLLLKKSYFFLIPMCIFLLAVMFNARVGLIPILFIILYSVFIQRNMKELYHLISCSLILFLFYSIYVVTQDVDITTLTIFSNLDWVAQFFSEIASGGGEASTINTMFGRFIILPDESFLEVIFGTGISLYTLKEGNSDVGFIIQWYYAGLIFLLVILFFIFYCFTRLWKVLGVSHWFTVFFIVMVIVLNTKGFVFAATPGGRLVFLLYMYFIFKEISAKKIIDYEVCYVQK